MIFSKNNFFETSDGAILYYEDYGEGEPIFLLHGFCCSSQVFRKNVRGLSKGRRLILMDLLGHGASSKTLSGVTMPRMAEDVKNLIEQLKLTDVTLLGWSMRGQVALMYWRLFAGYGYVRRMGVLDSTLYPFSEEAWNKHGNCSYNMDKANDCLVHMLEDHEADAWGMVNGMLAGEAAKEDKEWIWHEIMKTPPYIAFSIYSDFLGRGDDARYNAPIVNGESAYYMNLYRNKKGMTLNLKSGRGKGIFLGLVKQSDILLGNYRPGVMEKLGLGYDELRKINPAIVYGAVSGSGHPGGSLSSVELLVGLYFGDVIQVAPENPEWDMRDRFILSKGHVAPVLYSVLARKGFFPIEKLNTLRQFGSILQGHPHKEHTPGLDCSSGSLGQGLSIANGLAIAFKKQKKDNRVYCLMGDGELQEGQIWETAMKYHRCWMPIRLSTVVRTSLQCSSPIQ